MGVVCELSTLLFTRESVNAKWLGVNFLLDHFFFLLIFLWFQVKKKKKEKKIQLPDKQDSCSLNHFWCREYVQAARWCRIKRELCLLFCARCCYWRAALKQQDLCLVWRLLLIHRDDAVPSAKVNFWRSRDAEKVRFLVPFEEGGSVIPTCQYNFSTSF